MFKIRAKVSIIHPSVLETVVSSLFRDEAHGVTWPAASQLSHCGPLVFLGVVNHHLRMVFTIAAPFIIIAPYNT